MVLKKLYGKYRAPPEDKRLLNPREEFGSLLFAFMRASIGGSPHDEDEDDDKEEEQQAQRDKEKDRFRQKNGREDIEMPRIQMVPLRSTNPLHHAHAGSALHPSLSAEHRIDAYEDYTGYSSDVATWDRRSLSLSENDVHDQGGRSTGRLSGSAPSAIFDHTVASMHLSSRPAFAMDSAPAKPPMHVHVSHSMRTNLVAASLLPTQPTPAHANARPPVEPAHPSRPQARHSLSGAALSDNKRL